LETCKGDNGRTGPFLCYENQELVIPYSIHSPNTVTDKWIEIGSTYIDGGIGHNNFSKLAFHEAEQLYPTHGGSSPISFMINTGTGMKHDDCDNSTNVNPSSLTNFKTRPGYQNMFRRVVMRVADVQETCYDLEHLAQREHSHFNYVRLNVQRGLEDVKMDEWKPNNETFTDIQNCVQQYLEDEQVECTYVVLQGT
jgi:hypothetical protein